MSLRAGLSIIFVIGALVATGACDPRPAPGPTRDDFQLHVLILRKNQSLCGELAQALMHNWRDLTYKGKASYYEFPESLMIGRRRDADRVRARMEYLRESLDLLRGDLDPSLVEALDELPVVPRDLLRERLAAARHPGREQEDRLPRDRRLRQFLVGVPQAPGGFGRRRQAPADPAGEAPDGDRRVGCRTEAAQAAGPPPGRAQTPGSGDPGMEGVPPPTGGAAGARGGSDTQAARGRFSDTPGGDETGSARSRGRPMIYLPVGRPHEKEPVRRKRLRSRPPDSPHQPDARMRPHRPDPDVPGEGLLQCRTRDEDGV